MIGIKMKFKTIELWNWANLQPRRIKAESIAMMENEMMQSNINVPKNVINQAETDEGSW